MRLTHFPRTAALAGAAVVALTLAACGGGSSSTTSSSAAPAPSSSAASSSASDGGGENAALVGKKIGVFQSVGAAEVQQRTLATVQASADAFGWELVVVDGEGDPSKMQQRLQSLVDSKVDAIVSIFGNQALLTKQLEAAAAAGIPVVQAGFITEETPLIAAQYVADQTEMSRLLTERLMADFPDGGNFAILNLPANYGVQQRIDTFKSIVADKPQYKIVAEQDVPLSDIFGGSTKAAIDMLNANPDLSAFFSCCDFGGQAIAPALQQTKRDVPVYSFYAIPSVLDLVREGKVIVVENDEAKTGAMAMGALAAYWADGTPLNAATDLGVYPMQYGIVDKDNVPPTGTDVFPTDEVMQPFLASWAELYGI